MNPQATQSALLKSAPAGRVNRDLPCRNCGYNLRSLELHSLCPECAAPIAISLRSDLLRFANPDWLVGLILGLRFALVGTLGSLYVMLYAFQPSFRMVYPVTLLGAHIAIGANLIGAWLLTVADPGAGLADHSATIRKIIRAAYLLVTGGVLLDLLIPGMVMVSQIAGFRQLAFILAVLTSIIGWQAQLEYLQRLARRIPNRRAVNYTAYPKWLGTAGLTVWIGAYVLRFEAPYRIGSAAVMVRLADAARIGYVGLAIAFFAYAVLLLTLHRDFQRQLNLARQAAQRNPVKD